MRLRFVSVIGFSLFSVYVVNTILSILLPFVREDFGLSPFVTGLVISSYGWSITVMQIVVGVIVDRYEPRRILSLSMLFLFLSSLWFSISNSAMMLILSRLAMGLASSFTYVTGIKMIEYRHSESERGRALGLFSAYGNLGTALSNVAAPLILASSSFGWRGIYGGASVLALVAAGLCFFSLPRIYASTDGDRADKASKLSRKEMSQVIRNIRFWVQNVVSFAYFGTLFGVIFWLPTYLKAEGFAVGIAGLAVSLIGFGLIFGNVSSGSLLDKIGRRNPIMRSYMSIYVLVFVAILLLPHTAPFQLLVLPFALVFGVAAGGIAANTRLVVELFPEKLVGSAFGITNMVRWLGSSVYPLLIGLMLSLGYSFSVSFLPVVISMFFAIGISVFSKETAGTRTA